MAESTPDRTDSGQGRDAMDAAMDALERCYALYLTSAVPDRTRQRADVGAARAAVRKAAREIERAEARGEEYVVFYDPFVEGGRMVSLPSTYAVGSRVRVVKVEP